VLPAESVAAADQHAAPAFGRLWSSTAAAGVPAVSSEHHAPSGKGLVSFLEVERTVCAAGGKLLGFSDVKLYHAHRKVQWA
jgi:hypothetical protein